ncbi:MAG: 4a-hydroxytetrahydrobiopterin dehydratase [Thermoanaerobaculia bacterium]
MNKTQKTLSFVPAVPVEVPAPEAMKVVMRLKPERVQQLLLRLPGWRLRQDGRGLENVRSFRSAKEARLFVGDVCKLAEIRHQPVSFRLAGRQVTITLQGHPAKGCTGGINGAVFNLAGKIG